MDVVSGALTIIEAIGLVRGVYVRVKGLGKEVNDAMADCDNMETDVNTLKMLFAKKTSNKFPEQVTIIVKEFKSLTKSMKKLRKIFKEYEKISKNLFHSFGFAYRRPRAEMLEIRENFVSYRNIFLKSLHIINEGHNQDTTELLEDLSKQVRKSNEERKEAEKRSRARVKATDEIAKKSKEGLRKRLDDLVQESRATPENICKVLELWLVEEQGVGKEEAKSCASTALKEGKLPSLKKEDKPTSKKDEKEKKVVGGKEKAEAKSSNEKIKTVEHKAVPAKIPAIKDSGAKDTKIEKPKPDAKKSDPKGASSKPAALKEKRPEVPAKKIEIVPSTKEQTNKVKSPEAPAKKIQVPPPKIEGKEKGKHQETPAKNLQVAPPKMEAKEKGKNSEPPAKKVHFDPPKLEKKDNATKAVPKSDPKQSSSKSTHKPQLPVIIIQDNKNEYGKDHNKDKSKPRSPSPAPNSSTNSASSTVAVVGRAKPRASSASGEDSAQKQREMVEKNVRYVKASERRTRSQDPPRNLNVTDFE